MGALFLKDSLERLLMPEPVWFGLQSCILISCTAIVKLGMAIWFGLANKKIKSKTISAIRTDCFLDAGITVAAVISFTISGVVGYAVDAIFGIVISCIVIVISIITVKDNLKALVVGSSFAEEKETAKNICKDEKLIKSVLGIEIHDYGYGKAKGILKLEIQQGVKIEEFKTFCKELEVKLKEETNINFNITLV